MERPSPRILIVDDDERVREIISALLSSEGYRTVVAEGADTALELLGGDDFDLVMSDVRMPGHDGLWLLEQAQQRFSSVPFLLLTGNNDTESAVDALRRGAMDYLLKPPRLLDMVRAIERALGKQRVEAERVRYQAWLEQRVQEQTAALRAALAETERAYDSTLLALVAALDAREHETQEHSQRVVRYTTAIAQRLGVSGAALFDIGRGALLHDIGKIGVSDAILLKRGPLDEREWEEMRRHPEIGGAILKAIPSLDGAAQVVRFHHERFDGGGYPTGLVGEQIPLGARVFAVADTYDAITSDRPYRAGKPPEAARAELLRHMGTQFDPAIVRCFLTFTDDELRALLAPDKEGVLKVVA